MMIEDIDTFVAHGAVLGQLWRDDDITQVATAILNDVKVNGSVQSWNWPLGRFHPEIWIRRVHKESCKVEYAVQAVQDPMQDIKCNLKHDEEKLSITSRVNRGLLENENLHFVSEKIFFVFDRVKDNILN